MSDEDNLVMIQSDASADRINAAFYGRFPYPWHAFKFDYFQDPYFETCMLNQDIGSWNFNVIPREPVIWVAGCGTNQALIAALKFPRASVLGSDLSSNSLEICAGAAKDLGITNLELKQESINEVTYQEKFDYIISTGVIHHNAFPEKTLEKIATALKPQGVLELMVYNRFQWTIPSAIQRAVRILSEGSSLMDFEKDLTIAKNIISELKYETSIGTIGEFGHHSDSMLADELIQPILHSYTIESLARLTESCGLEIILPCLNQFDKTEMKYSWNIGFDNPSLKETYDSLPDLHRWQVTNLLMREKSPQLWFYLQRKDAERLRVSEKEVCERFLDTKFVRAKTVQRSYFHQNDGRYTLSPTTHLFPTCPPDDCVKSIAEASDGRSTIREIFQRLGIDASFRSVNQARLKLTTRAFPYLRSVEFR